MLDLRQLALPDGDALLVTDDHPIGHRLESRAAELRFQAFDTHAPTRHCDLTANITLQLKALGGVAHLRIVHLHALVRLVVAIGDRDHDAMSEAVDIHPVQQLAVQAIQHLFRLRIDDARRRMRIRFPVAEGQRHQIRQRERPSQRRQFLGRHHRLAANGDRRHQHRRNRGTPIQDLVRHARAPAGTGPRSNAVHCQSQ